MSRRAAVPDADSLIDRAEEAFVAFRTGDDAGMEVLVDLLTPILWHAARGRGAGRATAEEVVQSAWLALVDHVDDIRDPRAVLAWLLTTVRRDAGRRVRRDERAVPSEPAVHGARQEATDEPAPDVLVVRGDRQRRLWDHVQSLPERCRYLLRVVAFGERPDYAAIADALGMPIGSIGPTRGRCLDKLRRSLGADPAWEGYST